MTAIRPAVPLCCLLLATVLAGCGGGALEAIGLRKPPELPDLQKPPRNVPLRLHAAQRLNVDERGRALALAVRVYKLRQKDAFEAAPYAAFLNPQAERDSLGADLVEVREIMLVPGQRYESVEKVGREAGVVGVVALFHRPAGQRWRATVSAADAERDGVNIGLYGCALGLSSVGAQAAASIASVRCR